MKLKINKTLKKNFSLRWVSTIEEPKIKSNGLEPKIEQVTPEPYPVITKENGLTKNIPQIPISNSELNKSIIKKNDKKNVYSLFGFFACVIAGAAVLAYRDYKDVNPNDEVRDTLPERLGSVIDFAVLKDGGIGHGTHGRHAPRLYKLDEEKGIYIYVKKLNTQSLINELWINRLAYVLGIGAKSYLVKKDHGDGKSTYFVATKSIGINMDMQTYASQAKDDLQEREYFKPKNLMASLVFSYLIGDTDNKLKNFVYATLPNGEQIVYPIDQESANPVNGCCFLFTADEKEFLRRGGLGEYDQAAKVQDDGGQLRNNLNVDRSDDLGMGLETYGEDVHQMLVDGMKNDKQSAIDMLKCLDNMTMNEFEEKVLEPFDGFFTSSEKQLILIDFKAVKERAVSCLKQYELDNEKSTSFSKTN